MGNPRLKLEEQTLSPSSSGRRSIEINSPEFEFWMVRNPSFPQPNLLSADELFVDGVLLPLHLLPQQPSSGPSNPEPDLEPETGLGTDTAPAPGPALSTNPSPPLTGSKRWKDIFKRGEKKPSNKKVEGENKEKEKKTKKKGGGGTGTSVAELNINLWPFSRSRSAGNNNSRPRLPAGAPATRKVSSAPCSRSNSAGESKSRKWPSSPSRGGVHLGRSSPVWQVRRGSSTLRSSDHQVRLTKERRESRRIENTVSGDGGEAKTRVLNLNVPMCIGYRNHLNCRSDENSSVSAGERAVGSGASHGDGGSGTAVSGSTLFSLRSFFAKKVY